MCAAARYVLERVSNSSFLENDARAENDLPVDPKHDSNARAISNTCVDLT